MVGVIMPDPSTRIKEECLLIDALAMIHPTAKKNSLRRMIAHGRVRVGDERAEHPRQNIMPGSVVTILSRDDGDAPTKPKPVSYTHLTLPTILLV